MAAAVWSVVGLGVALAALPHVNRDARALVLVFSLAGPGCALAAARLAPRGHLRVVGLLLVLSAGTPTYFAWALNLPALFVGLGLVLSPTAGRRQARTASA